MNERIMTAEAPSPLPEKLSGKTARWELYRLLADPVRPKLLALTAIEELGVGELAELLREQQPKISRHAAALRDAGLLAARKQGTWTLLRIAPGAADDAVVADAVRAGTADCREDGTLARVEEVIAQRDAATREFFARGGKPARIGPPLELAAYLAALAPLIPHRKLAIDAGTGDGALLEVLAPVFEKVIALDRSDAQVELAKERVKRREFSNVTLVCGEIDGNEVRSALHKALGDKGGGADVVFASRVLHHMPVPSRALAAIASLARAPRGAHITRGSTPSDSTRSDREGGAVIVLDYETHESQSFRDEMADLWLGFDPRELKRLAREAGLEDVHIQKLPAAWQGEGPDRHLAWQALIGRRGSKRASSSP